MKNNINRQPLTNKDIEKGKDFDAVLNKYKIAIKPFYKRRLFYSVTGIAASIALIIVAYIWRNANVDYISQRPFIDPPCKNLQIQYADYIVPAKNGGTYQYQTGSKIVVPPNAFIDEKGNVIKGNVNLKYREFHDQADIMFSGIPMVYDSSGKRQLVSAGMLEIYAVQNGQSLKVNPKAIINIQMVTSDTGNKYNTYYLDTVTKKWNYISKANISTVQDSTKTFFAQQPYTSEGYDTTTHPNKAEMLNDLNEQIKKTKQELSKSNPNKPMEPMKADLYRQRFNIEVDSNDFPEVAVYKNVLFQITEDEKGYNRKLSNIMWSNVVIKADKEEGIYDVTFSRANESHTFQTTPVFDEKNYAQAKAKFDELYADYSKKLNTKIAEKNKIDSLEKAYEQIQKFTKNSFRDLSRTLNHNNYSVIPILAFGQSNCDHPCIPPPNGKLIHVVFADGKNNAVNFQCLYQIEKNINTAYFIPMGTSTVNLTYVRDSTYTIWGITDDGSLGTVSAEEFRSKTQNGERNVVLNVKKSNKVFSDYREAKDWLYTNSFNESTN